MGLGEFALFRVQERIKLLESRFSSLPELDEHKDSQFSSTCLSLWGKL